MPNPYVILAAIFLIVSVFFAGVHWNESKHEAAQVKVLQKDAKELPKIEKADNDRAKRNETIVIKAAKENPTDCFSQPISDDSLKRLRDGT